MTNQLFRDYLDEGISARPRIRPGVYIMPVGSFDPTAPTLKDLASAINLSPFITAANWTAAAAAAIEEEEREARNRAITEAAAAAGKHFADMEAALMAMGEAARNAAHSYTKPTPNPPWAGNITTQKRRRKL